MHNNSALIIKVFNDVKIEVKLKSFFQWFLSLDFPMAEAQVSAEKVYKQRIPNDWFTTKMCNSFTDRLGVEMIFDEIK